MSTAIVEIQKDYVVTKGEKSYLVERVVKDVVSLVNKDGVGAKFDVSIEKLRKNGYSCIVDGKELLAIAEQAPQLSLSPANDAEAGETQANNLETGLSGEDKNDQTDPQQAEKGPADAGSREQANSDQAESNTTNIGVPSPGPSAPAESGNPLAQVPPSIESAAPAAQAVDERIAELQKEVKELEAKRDADIEKIRIKYAEKIRKVTEKMKPLSVRRQEAYDLVLSLRKLIRENIDASLTDDEADQITVEAVMAKTGASVGDRLQA